MRRCLLCGGALAASCGPLCTLSQAGCGSVLGLSGCRAPTTVRPE